MSATASPRPRALPRWRASAGSSSSTAWSSIRGGCRHSAFRWPKIREALRASNMDVGGRTVELAETEFAVRGRGYIKSLSDLEQIVVKSDRGVPLLLKDVARIELTPDERRGITEMNGEGEVVSGIAL